MRGITTFLLAFTLLAAFPGGSRGAPAAGGAMPLAGAVAPPSGFVEFCARLPAECAGEVGSASPVRLTAERRAQIENVHAEVNREILYRPDSYTFGRPDYWSLPFAYGDCEDFALEKRRRLIALGWPPSSLLLALADVPGEGLHAVLVAVTDVGDPVLDNMLAEIRPWGALPYTWLSRQSPDRPRVWRAIAPRAPHTGGAPAAGR
jgi:predicted transglutaminase-like cysteine proteinase